MAFTGANRPNTDLWTSCLRAPSGAGAGSANAMRRTMTVQRELCAITSVPLRHNAGTIVHLAGMECFSLQCTSIGRDCCAAFNELATCVAGSVA